MTDDTLQFISWSRRGVGAGTTAEVDGIRRSVSLPLQVTAAGRQVDAPSAPIRLLGPADIEPLGADFGIVRRSPRPDGQPVEPNLVACIEFDHPDVPWLFTPEAVADGKLRPWVMLVVAKMSREREREALRQSKTTPYQVLSVNGDELPDPDNAWAFAHVQAVAATPAEGAAATRDDPYSPAVRSRLLCPTRLDECSRYFAAVVPVYEAARRLGVGEGEAHGGSPIWQRDDNPRLPVYDGWFFETGPRGDFEQLARRLSPLTGKQTDELGIGVRQVAFETRAALMQRQDDGESEIYHDVLAVPTAITRIADPGPFEPPSATNDPAPEVDALHFRLKQLVDIVAGAQPVDPIVGPPLYGQWHACTDSIDEHPENGTLAPAPADNRQTWVEQLNANPFLRIAAGLGTRLIQHDQEEYVAEAWRQLADIAAANRRTRWATMLSASTAVIQNKLKLAPPAVALQTMSSAVTRLRATDGLETVFAELQKTTLPVEAISAALTRTSRFAVRIGRFAEQPPATSVVVSAVAEAMAVSAKELLPARFTVARGVDSAKVGDLLHQSGLADAVLQTPAVDIATRLERIADVPRAMQVVATKIRDEPGLQGPQVGVELSDKLRDVIVKVKPAAFEKFDAARIEAVKVHVARIQAAKIEAARIEAAEVEAAKVDAAKIDVAKVKFDAGKFDAGKFDVAKVLIEKDAVGEKAFDKNAALKKVELNPFDAKVQNLKGAGAFVPDAPVDAGFAAAAEIRAEDVHVAVPAVEDVAAEQMVLPAHIFAALEEVATAEPEAGAEAIDFAKIRIVDAAEGFTLGTQLLGAPGSVVSATDGGRRALTAAAAQGIKELMLADIGDRLPSVDAQLGALNAADSALVEAEVATLAAHHVPLGRGPLIPDTITKFSFDIAAKMVEELSPVRNYAKLLKFANVFAPGAVSRRDASVDYPDELFPAMAAPLIQTPLATRLEKMEPDWLLGGLSKLPNNSICLMEINRQFVEALLVGANHEFGRELLWRGHPTDLRGTSFPRFWDGPDAVSIKPISNWTGDLGTHSAGDIDIDLVVVVIKGDLLRRYPNTLISAEKGVTSPLREPTDFTSDGQVAKEWFRGFIGSDVTYSVLGISHERLQETDGDDDRHCWYISLLEPYDELRFGLDEGDSTPNASTDGVDKRYDVTDTWTWQGTHPGGPLPQPLHLTPADLQCHNSSAIAGASLLQRPFRLLLRAKTYVPKEDD
ncbi:hypothetical protein BST22_13940 [Mycolicibacterium chubuense]|uniref:Uncharacterized protein n=1 Tax=Mycolicibacterium chubuense TaxID=1800 RepID=A0A0J6WL99_MYCCU|nr:hypothetical protein [Mycolicibacterium chubuense]KMO84105.1 hypothetical protein MCHUDSM44219_00910 [Mycolicibacterium chubuense]ORA51941.1 hypothetical protein BST22_13940 [Mycolicibacterium chubuense]SPX99871.1 Uncharacterised protein [Mycolicibacterium chubuense]